MAYEGYKHRNIGRLSHYLYKYSYDADLCTFGEKSIMLHNELYATYTWDKGTNVPTFNFVGRYAFLNETQKYQKSQIMRYDINILTDGVCSYCTHRMIENYSEYCDKCANEFDRNIRFQINLANWIMEEKSKNG